MTNDEVLESLIDSPEDREKIKENIKNRKEVNLLIDIRCAMGFSQRDMSVHCRYELNEIEKIENKSDDELSTTEIAVYLDLATKVYLRSKRNGQPNKEIKALINTFYNVYGDRDSDFVEITDYHQIKKVGDEIDFVYPMFGSDADADHGALCTLSKLLLKTDDMLIKLPNGSIGIVRCGKEKNEVEKLFGDTILSRFISTHLNKFDISKFYEMDNEKIAKMYMMSFIASEYNKTFDGDIGNLIHFCVHDIILNKRKQSDEIDMCMDVINENYQLVCNAKITGFKLNYLISCNTDLKFSIHKLRLHSTKYEEADTAWDVLMSTTEGEPKVHHAMLQLLDILKIGLEQIKDLLPIIWSPENAGD